METWNAFTFQYPGESQGDLYSKLGANALVVGGIAVEAICVVCAIVWTRREKKESDQKIAEITRETEQAKRLAEDANLARQKIEARLARRSLNDEQFHAIVEQLKEFTGTPASVVIRAPELLEVIQATNLLIHTVSTAGWRVVTGARIDRGPLVVGIPIGAVGVQAEKAGRTLAKALEEASIAARFDPDVVRLVSRFIGTGDPPLALPRGDDPSVVTIVVGIKPEEWKAAADG